MVNAGSLLNWRTGLLLVLPFFMAFGWAGSNWPVSSEPSPTLNAGDAAFQFGLFYLAVISLYYLLRSIVSSNSAFWGALFMALNPWFLHSLGNSVGVGMALALGAAALAARAAQTGWWHALMALAGAVYAASINVHAFGLTYLPVLGMVVLYLNHENRKHPVQKGAMAFAAGYALALLAVLDMQNLLQGFTAFLGQAAGGSQSDFAEAFSWGQLPSTFHLHILTGLWLLSAVLLFRAKGPYSGFAAYWFSPLTRPYGFCLSLCFVYGLIVMTLEGGMGLSLLASPELTVFAIPLACIGLAGALERGGWTSERNHRHAAALSLTTLTLVSFYSLQTMMVEASFEHWAVLVFWVVGLTLLMRLPAIQKPKAALGAVITLVVLAGFFLTGHNNPVWKSHGPNKTPPQLTQRTNSLHK